MSEDHDRGGDGLIIAILTALVFSMVGGVAFTFYGIRVARAREAQAVLQAEQARMAAEVARMQAERARLEALKAAEQARQAQTDPEAESRDSPTGSKTPSSTEPSRSGAKEE